MPGDEGGTSKDVPPSFSLIALQIPNSLRSELGLLASPAAAGSAETAYPRDPSPAFRDGAFACCTQNLNPCGGLRGALCKHLLVLIVGLANSGDIDAAEVDNWIVASKAHKPALDKDVMSETLLRYKGAEAGEIDWRPTETVPEDFYAF